MVSRTFVFCTARTAFQNSIWRSSTLSQEVTAIGTENERANRRHVDNEIEFFYYKKKTKLRKYQRDASLKGTMAWATIKKNVLFEPWRNLEPTLPIWLSGGFS